MLPHISTTFAAESDGVKEIWAILSMRLATAHNTETFLTPACKMCSAKGVCGRAAQPISGSPTHLPVFVGDNNPA